jgi:hypothetical protein
MATPRWIGAALAIFQKDSITIAGTWATADTLSVNIGTRTLVLTIGATVTTASIAQAVLEMINGDTITGDATRSDTGDNVPEFTEVTATLFSASVVHVTANTAGKPFTMTATEVTAGDGTATRAGVVTCTGPNYWDNADNWDTGVVPADTDTVYIDNSSVSILYGLDQSAIEPAAMYVGLSYTGEIGLPEINAEGGYYEYRSQYLSIGPAILKIGAGDGNGSGRIKINSTADACALTVFASGASADALPAIIWKGTEATNSLNLQGGSLGVAIFGAETATLATINQSGGSLVCGAGVTLSGALTKSGGTTEFNSAIATSLTQTGGETRLFGTGAVALLVLQGGSVLYNTTGTLGGASIVSGTGVLDFGGHAVATTVTNALDVHGSQSQVLDPNKRTGALVVDLNQGAQLTQIQRGLNQRVTFGNVA